MKFRTLAIVIALSFVVSSSSTVQAGWLKDQIAKFRENMAQNNPEAYARLMELRAERKRLVKEFAQKIFDAWKEYHEEIKPLVKARLELVKIELQRRLSIFRKKARARFQQKVKELIAGLPENVRPAVEDILNSEAFRKAKEQAAARLKERINEKLAELKARIKEKVQELKEKARELEARIQERIDAIGA